MTNEKNPKNKDPWHIFTRTVMPKKSSPEFEGLALQKKIEITIQDRAPVPPRMSDGSSFMQPSLINPGFLEFKGSKKIKKNTLIQGRIDLHGMTQTKAHQTLTTFIQRSYQQKKQDILVITGKGITLDNPLRNKETQNTQGKGILRHSLPRWLESSDLAPYVHFYTNTHPFEGGTGAFYVRLRKKK